MKLALCCVFLAGLPAASAAGIAIRLDAGAVLISGVPLPSSEPALGWQSLFPIYAGSGDVPPALGRYELRGTSLVFQPRFPFAPGVTIRAESTQDSTATTLRLPTQVSQPKQRVSHIYPTSAVIPENQLKFYIEFSGPMSRGEVWSHLRLLREDGSRVDDPFLEIEQELWDKDQRRLTVLFDPGRIKRGLLPLTEVGPAIEAGKTYTLKVSADWKDADGSPLLQSAEKTFMVGPPDRKAVDPKRWKISTPKAGTREALVVGFGESLDFALASRGISVEGVAGESTLSPGETSLAFVPVQPWKGGRHTLVVDVSLEDLAGNRVHKLFDVDVFERVTKRVESRTVRLTFLSR